VSETVIVKGERLVHSVPRMTIPQLIRDSARESSERTALTDAVSGRSVTYHELDHSIGRFAAGIAALGFKPGEVLLLYMPNQAEWLIAALGATSAGGIVSGANFLYGAAELSRQLRDSRAPFVITVPALLPTVREAAAALGDITLIVTAEAPGTVSLASVLACREPEPPVASDPETCAALPYSSGTSGLPKGVMLTHRNIVSNIAQVRQARAPKETHVLLAFLPMFHIYGFTSSLYCLAVGAAAVTLPRFEPQPFLKAIQDYRVTHLSVVPPIVQFLAAHPLVDSYDLSSLQNISSGAAPLGVALQEKASMRLKCDVDQGFGMTESSCAVAVTYPGRRRLGTCGQLLPDTEARVVDSLTQLDVESGGSGEIWFRGPQAFQGYLNNPTVTAETIAPDGWVRTGDVGHFDADGYLFITDRLKELIKVKGFQVAPAELEALLLTHPSVADAAVIGRADDRAGEVPVAYLVMREPVDKEAIRHWVAQQVIDCKRLGDVVFCESIPKSPTGKILRRELRAQDARGGAVP
jgi:acyl-CoA synthetase (AMP-forming)/AMP-acid ligase II